MSTTAERIAGFMGTAIAPIESEIDIKEILRQRELNASLTETERLAAITKIANDNGAVLIDPKPIIENNHTYFTGGAIKAMANGEIGGYLVAFGDPTKADSAGEYFHNQTDFALNYYPERPVLYHHGMTDIKAMKIGVIYDITPDEHGLYAKAILDVNHEDPNIRHYARAAYKMVTEGKLAWSSGSAANLVEVKQSGRIDRWPIVEGSLTPIPADTTGRTSVRAMSAALKSLEETIPAPELEEPTLPKEPSAKGVEAVKSADGAYVSPSKSTTRKSEKMGTIEALEKAGLSPEQIIASMKELEAAGVGVTPAEVEEVEEDAVMADDEMEIPVPPETDVAVMSAAAKAKKPAAAAQPAGVSPAQVKKMIEAAMKSAPANVPVPGVTVPDPKNYQGDVVVHTPTQALSASDISYMLHMRQMMAAKTGRQYQPDYKLVRELAVKAQKEINSGVLDLGVDAETKENHNNRILAIKANELDNTQFANAAGNWVPELWSAQLWRRVRVPTAVSGQFQVVEMPSATYDLPVESTDPDVYFVPETTENSQLSLVSGAAIPSSKVGASKVQLTAKKLALRVGFSVEMMEDSIIPFIPQLRDQALITMQNAIEYVEINGDTTNSGANINGTPTGTTDKFLAFNGMRYLGLVTNTAVATNAAGASPTLQMIRKARFKLINTLNSYALDPSQLVIITDQYTYGQMLNIDELLSWYNNGQGSTVNTGVMPNIDGITVIPSAQLPLTDSTGVVSGTPANNIYGTAIIASKQSWKVGYRRQVTSSLDYLSYYDSYQLTNTVRFAFQNKDTIANAVIYGLYTGM